MKAVNPHRLTRANLYRIAEYARLAAERYTENARLMREAPELPEYHRARLGEQFDRQAVEALALSAALDDVADDDGESPIRVEVE